MLTNETRATRDGPKMTKFWGDSNRLGIHDEINITLSNFKSVIFNSLILCSLAQENYKRIHIYTILQNVKDRMKFIFKGLFFLWFRELQLGLSFTSFRLQFYTLQVGTTQTPSVYV